MKKLLFILVLTLVMVTGCGESSGSGTSNNSTSVPSDYQGTYSSKSKDSMFYYVYSIKINSTTAQIVSSTSVSGYKDVDFSKAKTYDIKEIEMYRSGNGGYYELYQGDTKEYQCNFSFGSTTCISSKGVSRRYGKN